MSGVLFQTKKQNAWHAYTAFIKIMCKIITAIVGSVIREDGWEAKPSQVAVTLQPFEEKVDDETYNALWEVLKRFPSEEITKENLSDELHACLPDDYEAEPEEKKPSGSTDLVSLNNDLDVLVVPKKDSGGDVSSHRDFLRDIKSTFFLLREGRYRAGTKGLIRKIVQLANKIHLDEGDLEGLTSLVQDEDFLDEFNDPFISMLESRKFTDPQRHTVAKGLLHAHRAYRKGDRLYSSETHKGLEERVRKQEEQLSSQEHQLEHLLGPLTQAQAALGLAETGRMSAEEKVAKLQAQITDLGEANAILAKALDEIVEDL